MAAALDNGLREQIARLIAAAELVAESRADKLHDNLHVSLLQYVEFRFAESQKAIDKAENTMNLRLLGMNEFRQQMKDQAATFLPRTESDARIQAVEAQISGLSRLVYIGVGGVMLLEMASRFFVR